MTADDPRAITPREIGADDSAGADTSHTLLANRYEVIRPLGRGAFGRTFLANDRSANRHVAVKLLDARGQTDWKSYELFEREAAVLRSLRHHGIPEVYDSLRDVWNGAPAAFLVMEYVEGTSLADTIDEQRPLEHAQVVHLFLELLGIPDYLHGRVPPILHRDIKPANIIVRPSGTPALVDFGSVRRVFMSPDEAGSTVAGTYGYMPYEQYMGQASPSSDLYALGATFLHLVTGRPPREFMGEHGRLEVPETLPIDARLCAVIARLLRPSPAERFESARHVREALLSPAAIQPAGSGFRATPSGVSSAVPARTSSVASLIASLPPAPRTLEGVTEQLYRRVAPSAWDLMDASNKPSEEIGVVDVLSFVFFSVVTAGILPAVFFSMASSRRRRLRRFFRDGLPAVAEVMNIRLDETAFGEKIARVSYEFEADGQMRRDADQVRPVVADRWRTGDRIQVLYIPDRDYDSVIISPS